MGMTFLFAILGELSALSIVIVLATLVALGISLFHKNFEIFDIKENNRRYSNKEPIPPLFSGMVKTFTIILIIFLPLTLIPNTDTLWKARIGLIKLSLASPENITKGTEEIGRIAKKLECKYIGCQEEKKQ